MISDKNKNKFLEELEKTPIIQIACRKTNIAKATFYRWIKTDKKFKKDSEESLNQGRLLINDMAESKLIFSVGNGNLTAIIYWLKNNNPRYSEKIDSMSLKEKKKLIKRFFLSDQKSVCKILSEMAINKQLSKQTLNHFKYINSQMNKESNKKLSPEEKGKKFNNLIIHEVTIPTPKKLKSYLKEN
jgi:hypothetical protein